MRGIPFLHHHHLHRTRQLRWVLPVVAVLLAGAVASTIIVYELGDRAVSTEFFRAHKTIHETGELLRTGLLVALGLSACLVAVVAFWSVRVSHRIVRPVHALHQALDLLAAGELGTRVELHRHDEFQEIAEALNRVAGGFEAAMQRLRRIAAEIDELRLYASDRNRGGELESIAIELRETLAGFRLDPKPPIRADGSPDAP